MLLDTHHPDNLPSVPQESSGPQHPSAQADIPWIRALNTSSTNDQKLDVLRASEKSPGFWKMCLQLAEELSEAQGLWWY